MAPLKPGRYFITCLYGGLPIGRPLREDRSLLPKAVVALNPRDERTDQAVFDLELKDNGTYLIKSFGNFTANINDRLFAILLPEPAPQNWVLKKSERDDGDVFVVIAENSPLGWVLQEDEPGAQVAVRPLIVGPSLPPFYPPTELFKFTPVEYDD